MADLKWLNIKRSSKTPPMFPSECDTMQLNIPITHVCISSTQMKTVFNEELQISPEKIQFNCLLNSDKPKAESIEISCKAIKEIQYSVTKDILRIILQTDVYSKHFCHNEEEDTIFKDTIWFCINIDNLDADKDVITSLIENFISTFRVSEIPDKLHRKFMKQINKLNPKNEFIIKPKAHEIITHIQNIEDHQLKKSESLINDEIFQKNCNEVDSQKKKKRIKRNIASVIIPNVVDNSLISKFDDINFLPLVLPDNTKSNSTFDKIKISFPINNILLPVFEDTKEHFNEAELGKEIPKRVNRIRRDTALPIVMTKVDSRKDHEHFLNSLKNNLTLSDSCKEEETSISKAGKQLKRSIPTGVIFPNKRSKISLRSSHKLLYEPSLFNSVEITEGDLLCLSQGKYLNDNIINLYLTYIYFEQLTDSQRENTYFFNVFFNTKLIGTPAQQKVDTPASRHARVAKWTKNVDIFSKDFIVIPVIEVGHWFLVIVCFPWMAGIINYADMYRNANFQETNIPVNNTVFATDIRIKRRDEIKKNQKVEAMPCILIFDSIDGENRSVKVNIIREYLKSEWDSRRSSTDGALIFDKSTCRGYSPITMKQDNGTDCGLYLLQYVESFFKNPPTKYDRDFFKTGLIQWFERSLINNKRQLMKNIILQKTKVILPVVDDDEDCLHDLNIL